MIDPVTLEVLRTKLEAIVADGSRTTIRTAISPLVAEAGDCSCTLYSAKGELVVGGGAVMIHFHAGTNGIGVIEKLHGGTIAEGDVFLTNDPYNGGGLHAQDVFVHIPIFAGGKLCAWVGASAHMADMGGMVPGSFSTNATEVYQEAFRMPPVRLYRQGVEQGDVWAILRTNVRMANIVEMDLRSLLSGANQVLGEIAKLIERSGRELFVAAIEELADLTEAEVRRRVLELEPGVYRAASWSEWTDEFYHVPCVLTVEGDKLVFDFHGASPQTQHFLNSKPYVITSLLGQALAPYLAADLPYNEGLFRAFEVRCEPGSILDAQAPAPIGGPHLDVGQNASEVAMRAFNLAVAASPRSRARRLLAGPAGSSGMALSTLAGRGHDGEPAGWLVMDGAMVAASAGHDRDIPQMTYQAVGSATVEIVDTEVLESWYPMRFLQRGIRPGVGGAGQFCAGRPAESSYVVDGTSELSLTIMGQRERLPIAGVGGGLPGFVTRLERQRAGSSEREWLACHQENIRLVEGDTIFIEVSNGGGWGDPLLREETTVALEVQRGLVTADEALMTYGVVVGDAAKTAEQRQRLRAERLARATPAPKPLQWNAALRIAAEGDTAPLTTSVEQRGAVAVAEQSGAPLALSPGKWTDGCPRIHNFLPASPAIDVVAYLDPGSGALLAVDVVPAGDSCSFEVAPRRWTEAAA